MVDSKMVLFGQTLGYTVYAIVIILLVGWFGWRLTHAGKPKVIKPGLFYAFVAVLAVLGFSLHITTSLTIPWVKPDLDRDSVQADRSFSIKVAGHAFELPAERMTAKVGETVRFDVSFHGLPDAGRPRPQERRALDVHGTGALHHPVDGIFRSQGLRHGRQGRPRSPGSEIGETP
ncbi:MAG: cytochrome c oxidase, subunit [Candidatus Aminicenantes bacterium]|nr:cytochrome c oxidase, subunit [Candidatus Aminicenantes bacterium]